MWFDVLRLIISLCIILFSCELFTNGIEWLGKKLRVGDGVVGSIFSAVGTCLPETAIPIIAILFSDHTRNTTDIGIGAIAGAPFMLSTLAFFVTGISVFAFWKKRKTGMQMNVNTGILSRDISFFILVYGIGIAVSFVKIDIARYVSAVFLIGCYVYYIFLTVRGDHESHVELEELLIIRFLKVKPNILYILFQVALALIGILLGAELFVKNIETLSDAFGIEALALSLVITPIATELPEKFNSIIWISKRKDTLALGNISGAMVFQSCIPVSVGILATSWELDIKVIISALLALISAAVTYLWMRLKGRLNPVPLVFGGVLYAVFLGFLALQGFS